MAKRLAVTKLVTALRQAAYYAAWKLASSMTREIGGPTWEMAERKATLLAEFKQLLELRLRGPV